MVAMAFFYRQDIDPPLDENFAAEPTAAQSFHDIVNAAGRQARHEGAFTLSFDETQISSWMTLEGRAWAEAKGYDFPFENIQVGLDNGLMTVYGEVVINADLRSPVQATVRPGVDANGHLDMHIEQAHMGSVALPDFVIESLTQQIQELLTEPFASLAGGYVIDPASITVENGIFSMRGTAAPE
jgi:hypothetical protein